MPKIIKLNFRSPANLPIVPITPPPVPIPEIWRGLQVWIDPAYGVTSGQFPANHPAYPGKHYFAIEDAAGRLKYKDPAGGLRSDALNLADFDISSWHVLHASGDLMINGRPALQPADFAHAAVLPIDTDAEAISRWSTQEYTYMLAYKASAGATGGLFGSGGVADFSPMDSAQLRFGFESVANTGKTLYQHSPGDRLLINRDTATGAPVVAVITCNANNAGSVTLRTGGATTQHAFAFSAGAALSYTALGWVDDATSPASRVFGAFAKWGRALAAAEVTNLIDHMHAEYGPF